MSIQIPLHNAVEPLDDADLFRYRRNWLVEGIGAEGQARIAAARVLVVGAGGLGSPVLLYLAAAGVGTLGIADSDVVELSNLQRQLVHAQHDVGVPKPESAARHLGALNSNVEVQQFPHVSKAFLDDHGRDWDLIMDCTDSFQAKYLVGDWCAESGVPLVWGTAVGMSYQLACFWSRPPADVPVTSLRRLHPQMPEPGTTPSSTRVGVLGPVVGQIGTTMATEAIKLITGLGEPLLGIVMVADAAHNRYHTLRYAR